ncbi:nascent polypeptide-associated complex protein [Halostella sp. JP-L12]|uniref:nascent polypeptide-associated complex protein n=1 Tax=Halostella TaxID=1843185 RepID=UPI000EF7D724|nr:MULTISPECIES: nascent polypeptide-associated complex protein [Halostella]NHN47667.1 nascent polypeptide-associated complex protein [Halostella sp. JP-L12]
MFGGGGGGMNPRKMKQMMEQMGIDFDELDAQEVIIRTSDEDLVFTDADVTRMDAQGQQTYQVVGEPETREAGSAGGAEAADAGAADDEDAGAAEIPDDDVEIVAMRADVPEDDAREALEENDGDLAAAVDSLE